MYVDLTRQLSVTGGALLLLAVAACGVDEESYVELNERLLETLPEMAGSERLQVESSPYYLQEMGPADGYTTNVVYQAPPEMTDQEVVDFYIQRLKDEWEYCVENIPIVEGETGEQKGNVRLAHFFRERAMASINTTAMMSVNTDNMFVGGPRTFELAVDHRTYRNFCTGEDLR
jgi:hypothetical protein